MTEFIARIFIDTSVLKAARDTELVAVPHTQKNDWGHKVVEVQVHDLMYRNQNTAYSRNNPAAFQNRVRNRMIARLAKEKHIELLISHEVIFEAMGVPRVDLTFHRSPVTRVKSPVVHGGLVIDKNGSHLFSALKTIKHERFIELQKLTGAFQGKHNEPNKNQLFDAYHIWCAEEAHADYFLTHDAKLVRQWKNSKYKGICEPIDTNPLLQKLLKKKISFFLPIIRELIGIRRSGRNLDLRHQKYSDVDEEFK